MPPAASYAVAPQMRPTKNPAVLQYGVQRKFRTDRAARRFESLHLYISGNNAENRAAQVRGEQIFFQILM